VGRGGRRGGLGSLRPAQRRPRARGRPATSELAGLNTGYPVTQLAVTIAVAAIALPYLSQPLHRLVAFLVTVAAIAAVVGGSALPVNTISSLVLGWGVAAGLHLVVGSPPGSPARASPRIRPSQRYSSSGCSPHTCPRSGAG